MSAAIKDLTGYEIRAGQYENSSAGNIGVTVGMKGLSGNAGIAIGTGADSKNRIAGSLNGLNTNGANTDVTNAIAIGTGARANRDNAVALGGGSNTDKPGTKQTSYRLPTGVTATWSGGDSTLEGDIVSFGSAGFERQLKNVAPGEVSATSIAKLGRNENVTTEVLLRICESLDCDIQDIMERIPIKHDETAKQEG